MGSNYSDLVRGRVVAAVEASGMTDVALAEATMIPRSTLQRRLAGASPFTVNELDALANALGVPVALLASPEAAA